MARHLGKRCRASLAVAAALALGLVANAGALDVQGHRGARGLAPENTLVAFEKAIALGVTTLELDLGVSKDGVLVVAHDTHLNADLVRGGDGAWLAGKGPPLHALTLAELQRYDIGRMNPAGSYAKGFPEQQPADGQRIPTLAQVFALGGPTRVRFNIETKLTPSSGADTADPETFARLVAAAVRDAGLVSRVTVQSFDWRTLVALRRIAPEIATACLTIESPNFDTVLRTSSGPSPWHAGLKLADQRGSLPQLVKAAGCSTWSPFWRNVTAESVVEAHALGLAIVPWTVNDPNEMGRLVAMKVDGIITDYPDRLRKVLDGPGGSAQPR